MSDFSGSPPGLLAGYCLLALLAALAGGALPSLFRLTHARLQTAVSFVAGLMLGLSLLGLLPHASRELHSVHRAAAGLLGGFLVMFLLQRFLPFHHHDVAEGSPPEPCGHTHALAERSARSLSWMGVALGLSLHSIFDGLAMAAAVASGAQGHGEALGLGTALAVILHKPFGALAITTLMAASGTTRSSRHGVNLAFALVTPAGALLFYLGAAPWVHLHPAWLGWALAFCAGTFLCIACADLLPELQFHSHDRLALSLALLTGLGTAILTVRWGHDERAPESPRDHVTAHNRGQTSPARVSATRVNRGRQPYAPPLLARLPQPDCPPPTGCVSQNASWVWELVPKPHRRAATAPSRVSGRAGRNRAT